MPLFYLQKYTIAQIIAIPITISRTLNNLENN